MKTGRNDPCPCGSGLKYKKCCASKDEAARAAEFAARAADPATPTDADAAKSGEPPEQEPPAGESRPFEDPRAGKQQSLPKRGPPKAPVQAPRMPVRRKPV